MHFENLEGCALGKLRDVPSFGLSGEITDLLSARSDLLRHTEVPCKHLLFEWRLSDEKNLNEIINKLSEDEAKWSFFSAWTQVVDFYYEVNTAFSPSELQTSRPPRIIRTHVGTALSGLHIEHEELVDCMHAFALLQPESSGDPPPPLGQSFPRAPWATKLDAANFISCGMIDGDMGTDEHEKQLMRWMEKTNTTHSPQWHAWQELPRRAHAQLASPEEVRPTCHYAVVQRTRPVSSSALPNTVQLKACSIRFEKTLISACRTFKVIFVTEGYGKSYLEAEQQLWGAPEQRGYFVRLISEKAYHRDLISSLHEVSQSFTKPGSFTKFPKSWLTDFSRDVTCSLHTWSYYECASGRSKEPCVDLSLLLSHAREFMAGRFVSDASDIFTHWGPMYARDGSNSLSLKPINTSGSMPRYYRLPNHASSAAFVLRPKLVNYEPPCHANLLPECYATCCSQFFEERGYPDLGLHHFDLLRLECGFTKT